MIFHSDNWIRSNRYENLLNLKTILIFCFLTILKHTMCTVSNDQSIKKNHSWGNFHIIVESIWILNCNKRRILFDHFFYDCISLIISLLKTIISDWISFKIFHKQWVIENYSEKHFHSRCYWPSDITVITVLMTWTFNKMI